MNSNSPACFASRGVEAAPAPPQLFVSGLRSKRRPVIISTESEALTNVVAEMREAAVGSAGDLPKAQPDSNAGKKRWQSRLDAARPALALSLDDAAIAKTPTLTPQTGKTPTLTPHTMTETALKKSEDLLAKLVALGFSAEEDAVPVVADNEDAGSSKSDHDDALPAQSELVFGVKAPKQQDTVEVPVALLDMLVKNWSRYHEEMYDEEMYSEPLKASSSKAPSVTSSTTLDDLASDHDSLTSISPLQSPGTMSECSNPLEPMPSPPCAKSMSFPPTRHVQSPVVQKQMFDANTLQWRPTHLQALSPRVQWSPEPAFQDVIVPTVSVESRIGRRPVACTVQQTVTVTNSVTFHF